MASSCPTCGQTLPYSGTVRPKVKRENRNPYCEGHKKRGSWPCSCYPTCLECAAQIAAGQPDSHRFEHVRPVFSDPRMMAGYPARPTTHLALLAKKTGQAAVQLQAMADSIPARTCCGIRMGIMPHAWNNSIWVYQCFANPKHTHEYRVAA